MPPATRSICSTTFRRSQPDLRLRMRRDDDLVRRRLELCERVLHRLDGVGLDDEPGRGDALPTRSASSVRSRRRPAEARRVSS